MRIPHGVASAELTHAALVNTAGVLELIDFKTGALLAKSEYPATPLAQIGSTSLSYRVTSEALTVFAATPDAGVLSIQWIFNIAIPNWVVVGQSLHGDEADGTTLDVTGEVESDRLVVSWVARSRYTGGAYPSERVLKDAQRQASGQARISLADGSGTTKQAREQTQVRPEIPSVPSGHTLVPYQQHGRWTTSRWEYDTAEYHLSRASSETGISLHKRVAANVEETRPIAGEVSQVSVSENGEHVFVLGSKSEGWTVLRVDDAEAVGFVPYDAHTVSIAALRAFVLVSIEERIGGLKHVRLRCRSLDDGHILWTHELGFEHPPDLKTLARPPAPRR